MVVVAYLVSLLILISLAVFVARGRHCKLPLPVFDYRFASYKQGVGGNSWGQHVVGRALVHVAVRLMVLFWQVVLMVAVMYDVI